MFSFIEMNDLKHQAVNWQHSDEDLFINHISPALNVFIMDCNMLHIIFQLCLGVSRVGGSRDEL